MVECPSATSPPRGAPEVGHLARSLSASVNHRLIIKAGAPPTTTPRQTPLLGRSGPHSAALCKCEVKDDGGLNLAGVTGSAPVPRSQNQSGEEANPELIGQDVMF